MSERTSTVRALSWASMFVRRSSTLFVISLLRRLMCTPDGKARVGAGQGVNPPPRRVAHSFRSPTKKEAVMARFKRALARIEDHWLADLFGAASLFALGWLGLLIGHGWGL